MTEQEERVLKQSLRELYVKINILDKNDNFVQEISGDCTGGSYKIDASSSIRRIADLEFILKDGYVPKSSSPFWINKHFQLYIGLKDFKTNTVVWFNKGIYAIQDPSIDINIDNKKISISGVDKMALQDGTITGQLFENYVIKTGSVTTDESGNVVDTRVSVSDAIESTIKDQRYKENVESKVIIEDAGETTVGSDGKETFNPYYIPYDIEHDIGETKWDVISELVDLYYNYQAYYDVDGYFRYEQKPMYDTQTYPIAWYFVKNDLSTNIKRTINYSNVKNVIRVYGGLRDNYRPQYTIEVRGYDDDGVPYNETTYSYHTETKSDGTSEQVLDGVIGSPDYADCLFAIDKLDEGFTRDYIVTEDTYYTQEQCKKRAEAEVWLHQNTNDQITITCVPIYSLEANDVIYVEWNEDIVGRYVIDSVSCGLSFDETMTINAHRLDDKKIENVE